METNHKRLNFPLIWRIFSKNSPFRILSIHIPNEDLSDDFVWTESKSGEVRVKDM